jgi:hypothetical protein
LETISIQQIYFLDKKATAPHFLFFYVDKVDGDRLFASALFKSKPDCLFSLGRDAMLDLDRSH